MEDLNNPALISHDLDIQAGAFVANNGEANLAITDFTVADMQSPSLILTYPASNSTLTNRTNIVYQSNETMAVGTVKLRWQQTSGNEDPRIHTIILPTGEANQAQTILSFNLRNFTSEEYGEKIGRAHV